MVKCILTGLGVLLYLNLCAAVDSVRMSKLENVAETLKMPEFREGDKKIRFPQVPEGYSLELKGTDKLPVVDAGGRVGMPLTDQKVQLYFVLKDQGAGLEKDITSLSVEVKGEGKNVPGGNACPAVVPALREWVGATGKFSFPKKGTIVIDPVYAGKLQAGAEALAEDLKVLGNWNYVVKAGKPEKNAIYMTLETSDTQLGEEGYRMTIGEGVTIEAPAARGAFWATRSLLQMLQQQGTELVKGTTRDYPKYSRRGFMLDVARKFISLPFLQDYVKIMSYYKMNEFHVHLNDNGFVQFFDNDWDKTYAAFRLESDYFPELTAKDGHYTKKEFNTLQKNAMVYGVNVVPEIDVPAHSLAFSHFRKSLGSEKYGMDHLDLFNPEIYPFLDSLFREYLEGDDPVFAGPEVHIGTDEYSREAAEEFRAFTDHYLRYVQSFGKRARLWGALSHAPGKTPVISEGVIMNAWYNGYANPKEMIRLGFDLISTPDGYLYIVPAAGYYYDYLNTKYLYDSWEPVRIGNQLFPMGHPQVLGGTFAVWNDHSGNRITEKDVHHRAFPAMQVLAEKMWTGGREGADYARFNQLASTMIEAPGINIMAKVPSMSEVVLKYEAAKGIQKDQSGNGYDMGRVKNAKVDKTDGIVFAGNTRAELPVPEIGYNYTVRFDLCPSAGNEADAVLFKSPNAVVSLNAEGSGKLGFKREGYSYTFNYVPEAGKWINVAIQGDNKGTALYVDGKLVEHLQSQKRVVKNKSGNESAMYIQHTLVFPLQYIGDLEKGFKGKLKTLEVYNKKLY